jgi:membrane fusion protein (multidrug efflux system)
MKRKIILAIAVVVLVGGILGGIKFLQIRTLIGASKAFVQPPESVSSAVAREEKWQATLPAIGSIAAVHGVSVTTELPGTVTEIAFESGAAVAKGDLLLRLDTSSEEAALRAAEAQTDLNRVNAERTRKLRAENTISQAELDSAEATLKQNQANADAIRAAVEKKTIRAPFAGSLGIRLVNLGEYLDTGKAVVSLQSLDPVVGNFSLPQQELSKLATGMRVHLTTDAYPDRQFQGTLNAINPDLDPATRSVQLQAVFDNPQQLLRPGMFARMEVLLPEERPVLAIPATAILSAPFGDSVFVIEESRGSNAAPGLVVRQQFVRTGRVRGDFISVESGVKPGERVVSSGIFKLRNGMSVEVNDEVAPKATEKPRPSDG